jgi:hypothetical protein
MVNFPFFSSLPPGKRIIIVYAVSYIIVLDNLKSHKVADVMAEARRLETGLVFLPPCFPTELDIVHLKQGYLTSLCKAHE